MTCVSIVVPVYNVEPYLETCIQSVLDQSFNDWELILIDDGSTDSSGRLCDQYAGNDVRIRVIHKENGGAGAARNQGIEIASGKYIIFLDGDDYWEPDTLKILYSEAENNRLQLLLFSAKPFWDGIEPSNYCLSYKRQTMIRVVSTGPEIIRNSLANGDYYASPCLRFSLLSYLRNNRFRFDEGVIHEDESFSFLSEVFADRVECLDDRLYNRRYRNNSVTTGEDPEQSASGYCRTLESVLEAFLPKKLSEGAVSAFIAYLRMIMSFICQIYAGSVEARLPDNEGKKLARRIDRDSRKSLRKARVIFWKLPTRLKLASYSLKLSYLYYRLISSKQLSRIVNGLRRKR